MNTILLDVGGTFIKCSDGRSVPIDSDGSRESISASLRQAVGSASAEDSVAVAIPGPFDYKSGTFLMKHKFASVYGESFRSLAGIPDGAEVRYVHDVTGMLLGALTLPETLQYKRVALITLGTGLGFAFAVDGKPQISASGSPAVPLYNRPYLDGTAEDYASKRGFSKAYRQVTGKPLPEGISVKGLSESAMRGDRAALDTFSAVGTHLAEVSAPLLEELGIECLYLGGQISLSFHLMETSVRQGLAHVGTLRSLSRLPNIATATFDGLRSL